jgi:hypothetical protein
MWLLAVTGALERLLASSSRLYLGNTKATLMWYYCDTGVIPGGYLPEQMSTASQASPPSPPLNSFTDFVCFTFLALEVWQQSLDFEASGASEFDSERKLH